MSENWRDEEINARETAQAHAGEVVAGSGSRGAPRRMSQMVSVRLDGELAATLRAVARKRGITLSDLLRESAEQAAKEPPAAKTTVHVKVISGAKRRVDSTPDESLLAAIN